MSEIQYCLWLHKDGVRISETPHDPANARPLSDAENWFWERIVRLSFESGKHFDDALIMPEWKRINGGIDDAEHYDEELI